VIAIAIDQVETVIGRLSGDKAFRIKYCQDPDGTLESYLTPEEIRAIKTGDSHSLDQMGCGDKWVEFVSAFCGRHPAD